MAREYVSMSKQQIQACLQSIAELWCTIYALHDTCHAAPWSIALTLGEPKAYLQCKREHEKVHLVPFDVWLFVYAIVLDDSQSC